MFRTSFMAIKRWPCGIKINLNNHYKFCQERVTYNPFLEHYAENAIRAHRRLHLNQAVLNQSKQVVYAEIRKNNQDVMSLKQKGKCPGIIERFSGKIQDEIDVVLDGKKFRKLKKSRNYGNETVYVRVEGQEIRCIFTRAQSHSDGFITNVHLKQYIPGKPNKLTVPVELTHVTQNAYLQSANEFEWKKEQIQIISYNQEYPLRFYIDISFACPERPYRLGDLSNTFVPGIILHPKENPRQKICEVKKLTKIQKSVRKELVKQLVEKTKKKDKEKPGAATTTTTTTTATNTPAAK